MKQLFLMLAFFSFSAHAQIKIYEEFRSFEKEYLMDLSKDTIYVINFWATWCIPCVKELPYFDQLTEEKFEKPVKVLLVSLDMQHMLESHLLPFLKKMKVKSEVVALTDENTNAWIDKVNSNWSGALPTTIIINEQRKFFFEKSYKSLNELKNEIENTKD